jgi:multiple sugar transport system substrate-binding protein
MVRNRMFTLLCLLVLVAGMVYAGGEQEMDSASASKTITVWHFPWSPNFEEYMQGVADQYMAANPGITIKTVMLPWKGREAKFMAAIASKETPDITLVGADVAAKLEAGGGLVSFDGFNVDTSEIQPRLIKDTMFKGKMWGLPLAIETTAVPYNAKMLREAGISTKFEDLPKTWDEYLALAQKLTIDKNGDGVPEQYGTNWNPAGSIWGSYVPFLQSAGGRVFSEDGKRAAFNSPEGLEALRYFVDMHNKYKVIPPGMVSSHDAMYEVFLGGKTASIIGCDGDFIADLPRSYPDMEIVVGPTLKNKETVSQGWIGIGVVFKDSKYKQEAIDFIQFLARDDVNQGILEECGYVSVKTTITNKKAAAISPAMATAMEQTRLYGRPPLPHPLSRDLNGLLLPELQAAFLGSKTPEKALEDAEKAVQKRLDQIN